MENKTDDLYYKGFVAGYQEGIKAAISGKIQNPEEITDQWVDEGLVCIFVS